MPEYGFSLIRIFLYNDRIFDYSVILMPQFEKLSTNLTFVGNLIQ